MKTLMQASMNVINAGVYLKNEKQIPTTRGEIILFAEIDKFRKMFNALSDMTNQGQPPDETREDAPDVVSAEY